MIWKFLLIMAVVALGAMSPALAKDSHGVTRTAVTIYEDWPDDAILGPGELHCPGGEIEWLDPVTPVCTGSGKIHLRNVSGYGCYYAETGGGEPVPYLSGVGKYVVNGNLDADYTGPVWGTYMIVPSSGCNPLDLNDPDVYWKGKWQGRRSVTCNEVSCSWVGRLKLVGKGHGGEIQGMHFKGIEFITTFTPLPVPWELIPGFPETGPEGIGEGIIKSKK